MSLPDEITDFDQTIRKETSRQSISSWDGEKNLSPQIVGVLARGGMATIYEAKQAYPNRMVVVKKVDKTHDLPLQDSLFQEAMIMGALDHPNIIPVHQILMENGQPHVVMKRVRGQTFKEKILQGCSIREAIHIILQVCYAVEYAHERGIIHRDIKPSNIMIGDFHEIYLLDWGIAIDIKSPHLSMQGLVGSPSYMAPEMLDGDPRQITFQTDVYLLGSTLHYALMGTKRTQARSLLELFTNIENAEPYEYGQEIPKDLGILLNSACHRDMTKRPASIRAFKDALLDIRNHWEVIELLQAGEKKCAECMIEKNALQKETLYHQAQQDLLYTLRVWPTSLSAREALQSLTRHMIHWYLEQKNAVKAHALYITMEQEDVVLLKQILDLLEEDQYLNEEQKRLLKIGQEYDFRDAKHTSATFSMLIGFGAILLAIGANIAQFFYDFPMDRSMLLYSAVSMMFLIAYLMVIRRAAWMHNRSMERMCTAALGSVSCISLNRFVGLLHEVNIPSMLALDCFIIGLGALMVAQIVAWGYVIPFFCFTMGLIAAMFPTYALPCLSLISLVVPFGTWWAWRAR